MICLQLIISSLVNFKCSLIVPSKNKFSMKNLSQQSLESMLFLKKPQEMKTEANNRKPMGNILHSHPGLYLNIVFLWHVNRGELRNIIQHVKGKVLQQCHQTCTGSTFILFFSRTNLFLAIMLSFIQFFFFSKQIFSCFWAVGTLKNRNYLSSCLSWAQGCLSEVAWKMKYKKQKENKSSHKMQDGRFRVIA